LPNKNIQTWEETGITGDLQIKITVEAIYADNVLTSAKMTFYDYTNNPKGISSTFIYKIDTGIDNEKKEIPKAPTYNTSPPEPDSNFTIDGWVKVQPGINKINMLVLIDLFYGKPLQRKHEEGSILEISIAKPV